MLITNDILKHISVSMNIIILCVMYLLKEDFCVFLPGVFQIKVAGASYCFPSKPNFYLNDFKHLYLSLTETKDGKLRAVISMSANVSKNV